MIWRAIIGHMFQWLSYQLLVGVHVTSFIFNIALVVASDLLALAWVLGKINRLPYKLMLWLHRLVGVGLTVSILSGAYLFSQLDGYLLTVPAFYVKVALVLTLVINAFVIGKHIWVAAEYSFANLRWSQRYPLLISGAVSTSAWIGVYLAAQFLGL